MILVFGKNGQVANELQRQTQVLALGRDQADLMHPEICGRAIETHRPSLVINAAAWTAVDEAEAQEDKATIVNAMAPAVMARTCAKLGVSFLHLSTDYVFDGKGHVPWKETDACAPQNAYGRTKLAGEYGVQAAGGQWAILRTAWVFSAHGGNFVKTMLRLAQTRTHLRVVADQVGGPTPAKEIAATLLTVGKAMQEGHPGGLYHYAGQPSISRAGFARAIFEDAQCSVTVEDIADKDFPTPAKRPLNSRLDCALIEATFGIRSPDWRESLHAVTKDSRGRS